MAEVFDEVGPEAIDAAAVALADGRIVAVPTDTAYGLAAQPELEGATGNLFLTKRRRKEMPLPVLVRSIEIARHVAVLDERAERLARAFWPGALTIVLPRAERSWRWDLGGKTTTVGVRIPAHDVCLSLLRATGPLAVTSANISGEPAAVDCEGVRSTLGDVVAVYLCGGDPPGGLSSTVVDISSPTPRVLRAGEITAEDVNGALGDAR